MVEMVDLVQMEDLDLLDKMEDLVQMDVME